MSHSSTLLKDMLARLDTEAPAYEKAIEGCSSGRRGVHFSEIFFIKLALGKLSPFQIVESGRALGISTALLSRCYPETSVVSIEHDLRSPDTKAALEYLRDYSNVSCIFGDSRQLLPELTQTGDVVVIDGPKGLRALKLAFKVIKQSKPRFVFIHDSPRGSPIRKFMEKHIPDAIYSDDPEFLSRAAYLDTYLPEEERGKWKDASSQPDEIYGGTFSCIPCDMYSPSTWDALSLRLARLNNNVFGPKGSE